MIRKKFKQIGAITALSSALLFTNCAAQDLITGTTIRAIVGSVLGVYDSPRYYDRPYYYHDGRYYYGGVYRDGYYIYNGQRFRNGYYYDDHGYGYYKGNRYRPSVGNHGYYRNDNEYKHHHRPKAHRDVHYKESKRDKRQEKDRKHNR